MNIFELLEKAVQMKASDLHITVASPPVVRVNGSLIRLNEPSLYPQDTLSLAKQLMNEEQQRRFEKFGEIDFSYSTPQVGRFRINIYKQRGSCALAIRVVNIRIPSLTELGFPECLKELAMKPRGLILVTGPTGSGKSTTLASMIDYINHHKTCHIITLEDPIEYLHKHDKSIINQREIGSDSLNFHNALKAAFREDPDVIMLGEMRNLETISTVITAAETGHLVMSTLHTIGAANTIDRIIDVFPPHQQQQVRVQLSMVLEGIISQQLLPRKDGEGRIVAYEILLVTSAIRNQIREGKTHQIQNSIQTGARLGMKTMDASLGDLVRRGLITREAAYEYAISQEMLERFINM